jgi:hypothetical protein
MPEGETTMAFQAIVTKFIGPSNVRGARVKATADAGSITLSWDHALNHERNHKAAAMALASKYGWHGRYVGGGMPSNTGNVYVCDDASFEDDTFTL